ncbi:protein SRG1-like isoform X3 [Brachypodium distachyon]|uniref:protein SRG1-like isoform X3 n=1 Tax=Brachypodium distachyon TaxID=15368 RepID=UPI00071C53DD|nr:protein SRG1-like isoform X3 [Brachypodium distachyon]|eukprot:XP_003564222.2 protein SRG1-like isoform X3 [Brachypodium distachyon]
MAAESWRLPNSVQQLAVNVQEPPSQYLLREQEPLGWNLAGTKMPEPIPTIDLGLLSASSDAEEAAKLRSALQNWGFFQVSNHGMETSLMDSVMTASRDFFHLPIEEKRKYSNLIDGKHFQIEGYGNDQVKTQDQRLDWSDRLHLKVEPENERNLAHWPIYPKSFRDDLHEYTLQSKRIKDSILQAMAKLLEIDEDCLVNQFSDKALTYARFNYYPPCPRPDLVLGIKPHSDVFVLTVLLMDKDVAGLQVLREGTWYSVPTVSNYTLLINVGVTMEIMTNGIFKGPVHRVVTNAEKERISVAMFYGVDPEKEIGPIEDLLNEEQPARYRKMKAQDFLIAHYEHFTRGERIVDSLKIFFYC